MYTDGLKVIRQLGRIALAGSSAVMPLGRICLSVHSVLEYPASWADRCILTCTQGTLKCSSLSDEGQMKLLRMCLSNVLSPHIFHTVSEDAAVLPLTKALPSGAKMCYMLLHLMQWHASEDS